jgi:4-amino-4-deoxy-L-arabinose transferase-like glycosyltransferase
VSRLSDNLAVVPLLALSALAASHLMVLPVFEDEGTQLRLIARLIGAGEWLQPLVDGKPLETWLMAPLALGSPNPIVQIRAVHVLAGVLGVALTLKLAAEVTGRGAAVVCALLFAMCPFVVYLQRLALADILLCVAGVWTLSCVFAFANEPTRRRTVALALALGLTAFCKFPVGFIFLAATPMALLLMCLASQRREAPRQALPRALLAHLPALAVLLVVCMVAAVRMRHGSAPGFGLQDLMAVGFGTHGNIATAMGVPRPTLLGELSAQLSWPMLVLGFIGLAGSLRLPDWRLRWLLCMGTVPMLAIALLARFWFSRYLLFTLPPLIIVAVCGWRDVLVRAGRFRVWAAALLLGICVAYLGRQSVRLVIDPSAANWSRVDRFQYLEGWSSGYGYPEAADFIVRASGEPRAIYSLDGHGAYQLRSYLPETWGSRVRPVFYAADGTLLATPHARLGELLQNMPAWIVEPAPLLESSWRTSFGQETRDLVRLRPLVAFDKPGGKFQLVIYEATRP